jgi:hypothetical protein
MPEYTAEVVYDYSRHTTFSTKVKAKNNKEAIEKVHEILKNAEDGYGCLLINFDIYSVKVARTIKLLENWHGDNDSIKTWLNK